MHFTLYKGNLDRLTIFNFMLAVTHLFHQLCEPLVPGTFFLWLFLTLAALALLFRPSSVILLILVETLSFSYGFLRLPDIHNHIFFQMIIDLLIILSVCYVLLLRHLKKIPYNLSSEAIRDETFDAFAPVTRTAVIILYFFAVFHKFNWDFFDPKYSRAVSLLKGSFFFVTNIPNEVRIAAIYSTLVFEGGIAILLCFRRTRTIGIFIGLLFHFCLSLNLSYVSFSSFSSMLYAMFFTFTPRDFPAKVSLLFNSVNIRWASGKGRQALWLGLVVILILLLASFLLIYVGHARNVITIVFVFWWLVIMSIFLSVMASYPIHHIQSFGIFKPRWPIQWFIPAVLFFNGINPYLGLKTDYSFNMFAGLLTEGGKTNHLFMGQWFKIAGYQDDLVEILVTNHPKLVRFVQHVPETKLFLTYFDFQKIARKKTKDFFVEYKRNGKPLRLEVKNYVYNDSSVLKPHSWLENKFLNFIEPIKVRNPDTRHSF